MRQAKSYEIDPMNLRIALARRCLSMVAVSEAMGYYKDHLAKCVSSGKVNVPTARMLDCMFGISPSEYTKKPVRELDYQYYRNDVKESIREAMVETAEGIVREALKEAMIECVKGWTNEV